MNLFAIAAPLVFLLQTAPPPPAKASISGTLVSAGTTQGIPKAQVTLTRAPSAAPPLPTGTPVTPPAAIPPVSTDAEGKFEFKDLDAGSYRVSAARNGYARQEYGQRVAGSPGVVLTLTAGQVLKDLSFSLTPAGTITGNVVDASGQPVTGIQVQVLRPVYLPNGQKNLTTAGGARTDDRGEYRIYWVTPGRYYINATSQNTGSISALLGVGSSNEVPESGYPTVYYPGTTDSSRAVAIDLRPGSDLTAINFVLPQAQNFKIRGRVVDVTGQPPKSVSLSVIPRVQNGGIVILSSASAQPKYDAATGIFELPNIGPGAFWLRATSGGNINDPIPAGVTGRTVSDLLDAALTLGRSSAQVPLDVAGSDVEGITVTLNPGFTINGQLSADGLGLSAIPNFENLRVSLRPTNLAAITNPQRIQPMKADGSFTLDSVVPGEYRIQMGTPSPEYFIKEATYEQNDVLTNPWVLDRASSGSLNIVISNKGGLVDGTIVDARQQPVLGVQAVLIPDRTRDRIELYKTVTSDASGHFTLRGIPPGDYKVFSWESLEPYSWMDADVLKAYESQGKPVHVSESSKQTIELRPIPLQP